tara:strand:+ start:1295 stop:2458 length:1164 start_codon:yes stop_codon:yes gene_type:complete
MDLYNDDCFNVFPKIKDKSINLFLLDLPYGQTACKWDSVIDLDKMWVEVKRMMKPNGIIIFFCTAKFGNTIINSNPKWFKYDLIWKKSRKVGFLSANKQPLRQHENIYVFNGNNDENEDLMNYSKKVLKHIGKTKSTIKKEIPMADHFFRYSRGNFSLPIKETYDELIKHYKINEMEEFIPFHELQENPIYNPQKTEGKPYKNGADHNPNNVYGITKEKGTEIKTDRHPTSIIEHENLYIFNDKPVSHSKNEDQEYSTYNPQKTEGKPYKVLGGKSKSVDGSLSRGHEVISKEYTNNGDRHPTSIIENTILEYNNPAKSLHRTQKPVELCEWLIKTYTNEDDVVMDFTMGSGTTGIACINTNREFIGVEMDKEIFEIAEKRILEHLS